MCIRGEINVIYLFIYYLYSAQNFLLRLDDKLCLNLATGKCLGIKELFFQQKLCPKYNCYNFASLAISNTEPQKKAVWKGPDCVCTGLPR